MSRLTLALYQPSVITVDCSGETHRLRWAAGDLTAVDHHDPDVEKSLAELSGRPSSCLDMVASWNRHSGDPKALLLGPRTPTDKIADCRPGDTGWPFPPRPDEDLLALLALDPVLSRLLVCTVAEQWVTRIREQDPAVEEHRSVLAGALFGRVVPAIWAWLDDDNVDVRVRMADDRQQLVRYPDRVDAFLPFDWIVEVWGIEVTSIFGSFVLTADAASQDHLTLSTIGRDFKSNATVTITTTSEA